MRLSFAYASHPSDTSSAQYRVGELSLVLAERDLREALFHGVVKRGGMLLAYMAAGAAVELIRVLAPALRECDKLCRAPILQDARHAVVQTRAVVGSAQHGARGGSLRLLHRRALARRSATSPDHLKVLTGFVWL